VTTGSEQKRLVVFDKYLLFAVLSLAALGILLVTSASMVISDRQYGYPFHYLFHQLIYFGIGSIFIFFMLRTKVIFWENKAFILLLIAFVMLVLVLVPGIGHRVNGSRRWIGFGPLMLQVSEYVKFAMVVYLSSYLVRHQHEVKTQISGFLKPLGILGIIALLLLIEPDFGATFVITMTVFGLMFLGGARVWQFILILMLVILAFSLLAIMTPYRMQRLTTFLDPWGNQYHSGYQLVQSLIAFGRGGIFGVGLGDSVQKLFYLPEAHTDFLFAVLAEELGLIGILLVIGLYVVLVWRTLLIGRRAQLAGFPAAGYMAYGFAVWIGMQALINMGVDSGLLPTKGLTLPLMSYGGSSVLSICIVMGLLFRIDYEVRSSGLAE
jgi:cell division protein FtsW